MESELQQRATAWTWTFNHCNGTDNVGLCPICGERIMVTGRTVTEDGRLIGSCGDAFTIRQWEAD